MTPAAMSYQGMDRFSSFAQCHHPRKSAEQELDKSLAANSLHAEDESRTHSMPILRHKAAMTAHQAASIVRAASDEADAYERKVEEQLRARDELRQRMRAKKGEDLHPAHFGGGYCSAGRTVPRANGSSLVCMASLGRLQEVKARVERAGEDVNSMDSNGETALAAAASAGDLEMCRYLISRGAEVLTKGPGGVTALHYAARTGSADIIHLFCNTADFYRPDLDIKTSGRFARARPCRSHASTRLARVCAQTAS